MAKVVAVPVLALALLVAGSALRINEERHRPWPVLEAVEQAQFKKLYEGDPGVAGYEEALDDDMRDTDECHRVKDGPPRRDLTWNEKAAIFGYSGMDYIKLNDCLRDLHEETDVFCIGHYSSYIRTLNRALHQLPTPKRKQVWRYDQHYVPPHMRLGCIFREKSFLSTTRDRSLMEEYPHSHHYTINLNDYGGGKDITCYSEHPAEEEILWPSKSLFFVTALSGNEEDGMRITMEPLSPEHDQSKGFCNDEPSIPKAVWVPFVVAERNAEEAILKAENAPGEEKKKIRRQFIMDEINRLITDHRDQKDEEKKRIEEQTAKSKRAVKEQLAKLKAKKAKAKKPAADPLWAKKAKAKKLKAKKAKAN